MTGRWVIHDTVTLERRYRAARCRVFAAFASAEAKNPGGDTGDLEPAGGPAGVAGFGFQAGGRERFGVTMRGTTYRYDARYCDIVPGQRIICAYELYAGDARISVSAATIEFATTADGTALTWTGQGAYLDGTDGPQAPSLRRQGTTEMLDGLARHLARHTTPGRQAAGYHTRARHGPSRTNLFR